MLDAGIRFPFLFDWSFCPANFLQKTKLSLILPSNHTSMKEADQLMESVGESIGYAKEYIEQNVALAKLEFAERMALITSTLVTSLVFFLLLMLLLAVGSVSLGFWLGDMLGSYAQGFLIVSGIYFVLILILYVFRRRFITNPILNQILTTLHKNDENEK